MCGIAGIFSFSENVNENVIKTMADTITHRGPDGYGCWISDDEKTGLGHRRLSIIDLSRTASQPMHSHDNRYVMVFNGEIYNYIELKENLIKEGYNFNTNSDTEVLLVLYSIEKESCLNKLDGMFAFAIYDKKEKTLFAARDRFGEKPFYFNKTNKHFAFASEIKSLFAIGVQKTVLDENIFNYLLYNSVENPHKPELSFYENISQLKPAHYITIRQDGKISESQYWDIDIAKKIIFKNEKETVEQFTEIFNRSVSRRLRSDVPIGSNLSGGLDSSSIVFEINKIKNNNQIQKTFSARFPGFVRDESKYIDAVISKTNLEPISIFPSADTVLDNLEKIWFHQEIPFGSTSIAAQYEVMKAARANNVIVLLDGQGADETLAGYFFYRETYLNELYCKNKTLHHHEVEALKSIHNVNIKAKNIKEELMFSSIFPQHFLRKIKRFLSNPKSDFYLGINPEIVNKYKNQNSPYQSFAKLKQHLYYSTTKLGLQDLLRYADRNAMAHSVEVRLPFLSHELVEFEFSLPPQMLIKDGWTKYILRKSKENELPKEIVWRKDKVGYEPPQKDWFANPRYIDFFKTAETFLINEKIITKSYEKLKWEYLMLYLALKKN